MKKQYFIYFLLLFCSQLHAQQQLTKVEYFVDADPGYGLGVDIPFTAGTTLDVNFSVSLPGNIAEGFHYVTVRVKNTNNQWSAVLTRPFLKESLTPRTTSTVTAMEYFIDADPGYGAATAIPVTAALTTDNSFTIPLPSNISEGFHYVTVRVKDANNQWSSVITRPFLKESLTPRPTSTITVMEYFIDTDPGYGAATSVNFTAGTPVVIPFTAALGNLPLGNHNIYIRVKDANNQWSMVGTKPFTVASTFGLVTSQTPSAWCKTAPFNVFYQVFGTYASDNVFTAQLSDASGSFASPTTLGTLASVSSGSIVANIPPSTTLGTGYRIRVLSSSPAITDNPSVEFSILDACPPPCATSLTLVPTTDDYSSGVLIKETNAQTGIVVATNRITGTARVTYLAGKSVTLNPGFFANNGTVFIAQKGGCQ
ncbi:3-coathanger stack domain-containing protein [Emticicia sp.]|uniref:3-coathanger stack domain-containing protein n=1 Tax=Emticicia sp. TaxID=1930953 RepID=UPI0037514EC1